MKRPPDRGRRCWHVDMGHAKRIGECRDHRLRCADRAGLAGALHAKHIVLAGDVAEADVEARQIVGAWQRVVHQRPGDELALLVKSGMLVKRLADPQRKPAMHLTFQHQRIDHGAENIHHGIAKDIDLAGARVDLKFHHMAAIGIGGAVRLVAVLDIERVRPV